MLEWLQILLNQKKLELLLILFDRKRISKKFKNFINESCSTNRKNNKTCI